MWSLSGAGSGLQAKASSVFRPTHNRQTCLIKGWSLVIRYWLFQPEPQIEHLYIGYLLRWCLHIQTHQCLHHSSRATEHQSLYFHHLTLPECHLFCRGCTPFFSEARAKPSRHVEWKWIVTLLNIFAFCIRLSGSRWQQSRAANSTLAESRENTSGEKHKAGLSTKVDKILWFWQEYSLPFSDLLITFLLTTWSSEPCKASGEPSTFYWPVLMVIASDSALFQQRLFRMRIPSEICKTTSYQLTRLDRRRPISRWL